MNWKRLHKLCVLQKNNSCRISWYTLQRTSFIVNKCDSLVGLIGLVEVIFVSF